LSPSEIYVHRDDVEVGFVSHVGMVRNENQDSYGYFEPEDETELRRKGRVLIVCDGMGGHNGGTIASRTTVDAMLRTVSASRQETPRALLLEAISTANHQVREKGMSDPELRNMGTTCVAMVLRGKRVEIANVGDSRCYVFRKGQGEQVTRDHTYLNDLVDIGLMTPEAARKHPERNIITRCVGMSDELQIDFVRREVLPGDVFLLCSDGLYNHVEDHEMLGVVSELGAQAACQALVDLANKRGGEDNITVAVLKVNEIPSIFDGLEDEAVESMEGASEKSRREECSDAGSAVTPRLPMSIMPVEEEAEESGRAKTFPGARALTGLIVIEVVALIVLRLLISRF